LPTEILLPAFALTLLANAVLVAAAIRGMRRRPHDPGAQPAVQRAATAGEPGPRQAPAATPANPTVVQRDPSRIDVDNVPATGAAASKRDSRPRRRATAGISATLPGKSERAGKRPAATPRQGQEAASRSTKTASGRGRRRFSLPPLDADHEKVSRSIESFLASGESESAAAEPTATGAADRDGVSSVAGATTVALIAVDRVHDGDRGNGPGGAVLATIERVLRTSVRGSDVVSNDGPGRYRVVLDATGELAARAYLRRLRAAIAPLLEGRSSAGGLLRVRIATATTLDEPIAIAIERAERRLAALPDVTDRPIQAAADAGGDAGDDEDVIEPRAAGD